MATALEFTPTTSLMAKQTDSESSGYVLIENHNKKECPGGGGFSVPGARFTKVRTNDFCSTNSLSLC